MPLCEAGLDVVGIEAGGSYAPRDFPADEIRNDIRNWLGRVKVNNEVPTQRLSPTSPTTPAVGPARMMNAVGGRRSTGRARAGGSRRGTSRLAAGRSPATGPARSRPGPRSPTGRSTTTSSSRTTTASSGSTACPGIDGLNPFAGPRARGYPLPPLRRTGWTEFMRGPQPGWGGIPFPGPAAIRSAPFNGMNDCDYHGFCTWGGCHVGAKASTSISSIPRAEKTGNLHVVQHARAFEIVVDGEGLASGVNYLKGGARTSSRRRRCCSPATRTRTRGCSCSRGRPPIRTVSRTTTGKSAATTCRTGSAPSRSTAPSGPRPSTATAAPAASGRPWTTGTRTTSTTAGSASSAAVRSRQGWRRSRSRPRATRRRASLAGGPPGRPGCGTTRTRSARRARR